MHSSLARLPSTSPKQPSANAVYLATAGIFFLELLTLPMSFYLAGMTFGTGVYIIPGLLTYWLSEYSKTARMSLKVRAVILFATFLIIPTILLVYVLAKFRRLGTIF